jgi:hypothetical protein
MIAEKNRATNRSHAQPISDLDQMSFYGLLNEADHLHDLLVENEPESSVIRKQFAQVLEMTEPQSEYFEPSTRSCLNAIRKAMTAFAQLPAADRKRVFNGWEPPLRKSRDELLGQQNCEYPTTYLQLEFGSRAGAELSEFFDEGGSLTRTRVMFRAGMTREEALRSLKNAKAYVEQQWDDLIANRATDAAGYLAPLDEERPQLEPNDLTPAWIDAFFQDTCEKLDKLDISYSEDGSPLVLPDGTLRKVFCARNHNDDGNAFLGPIVKAARSPKNPPESTPPRWWSDPRFSLTILEGDHMGANARFVEIQETANGIRVGTLAVVIVCDNRRAADADQIAEKIVNDPATLDELKKERGIIDRRDWRPGGAG